MRGGKRYALNTYELTPYKKYKNVRSLKADGRGSLLGHLTTPVVSVLVYDLLSILISYMISGFNFENQVLSFAAAVLTNYVVTVFTGMLEIGILYICLSLQFEAATSFRDLFVCFRENPNKAVILSAFMALGNIICTLPSLLVSFFWPDENIAARMSAIAVAYLAGAVLYAVFCAYFRMAQFLLLDFPDIRVREMLRRSVHMMKGSKGRYFGLFLSFIPLDLLGLLSFGLAQFWITSYYYACCAAFYCDLVAPSTTEAAAES